MKRFVQGEDRTKDTLLPRRLDDYIAGDNPVRVMEVFVEALDLVALGFEGVTPSRTGRPAYHPIEQPRPGTHQVNAANQPDLHDHTHTSGWSAGSCAMPGAGSRGWHAGGWSAIQPARALRMGSISKPFLFIHSSASRIMHACPRPPANG